MEKTGDAYDNAVEIAREMRGIVAQILRCGDKKLADDARRSTQSMGQNVREGRKRKGADGTHQFRIALGSADETVGALDQAEAWGYVREERTARARALLGKELAMLWKLAGPPRGN